MQNCESNHFSSMKIGLLKPMSRNKWSNFDDEYVPSTSAPVASERDEATIAADVSARRIPVVAIDRMMMRQSSYLLRPVGSALKNFVAERTDWSVAGSVVADHTPRFVVCKHRSVIRLRPVVAEANYGLKMMRRRKLSHGELVVPIVITHDDLPAVVCKHRYVIRLRPVVAEANYGLKMMRRRKLSHGELVVPIVITHDDLPAVVAVSGREVRRRIREIFEVTRLQIDDLNVYGSIKLSFHCHVAARLVHLNFIEVSQVRIANDPVLITPPHKIAERLIVAVLLCKGEHVIVEALAHLSKIASPQLCAKVLHKSVCPRRHVVRVELQPCVSVKHIGTGAAPYRIFR